MFWIFCLDCTIFSKTNYQFKLIVWNITLEYLKHRSNTPCAQTNQEAISTTTVTVVDKNPIDNDKPVHVQPQPVVDETKSGADVNCTGCDSCSTRAATSETEPNSPTDDVGYASSAGRKICITYTWCFIIYIV